MAWRIIQTTDNQHIGTVLEFVEAGQIIQFADGDVIAIDNIFADTSGDRIMATNANYQMTLVKE
jgi:hypothetical protein